MGHYDSNRAAQVEEDGGDIGLRYVRYSCTQDGCLNRTWVRDDHSDRVWCDCTDNLSRMTPDGEYTRI